MFTANRICSRSLSALIAAISLLLGGVACEDPLASFEEATKAFAEGQKLAAGESGGSPITADDSSVNWADDEAAKAKAGGLSLGPDAKRLYYQFIDGKGRVRFVERLSDVPEKWRQRVGFVEMDSAPPLSPAMAE